MYNVKKLTEHDFQDISRIFLQTFPRTDDADFATAWRTKECNYSLGLYHKATLVGFAITCLEAFADADHPPIRVNAETGLSHIKACSTEAGCHKAARLWFIAVDPAQRSSGAGTQLLTALIDACLADGLHLVLTPDNKPRVISWYKRHGFVITKIMPFVHDDIPIYWMEWVGDESSQTPSTQSLTASPEARGSFSSDCSEFSLETAAV